jgi:hypothetical protein
MNSDLVELAAPWLAVALVAGVAVIAAAMLSARTMFVMCVALAAMAALGAAALAALDAGEAAIALAAFGVGIAPVLMLSGVLLSARAAKRAKGGLPVISAIAIGAGVMMAVLVAPELGAAPQSLAPMAPGGVWLAVLVFVAAAGCAALLGYSERGVLERRGGEPDR